MKCINESIDVSRYNYLGEAYDKEWALKDEAFRDGVNEGISMGISQGIEQNKMEIAKNLLKQNVSKDIIVTVTGLSIDTINTLE